MLDDRHDHGYLEILRHGAMAVKPTRIVVCSSSRRVIAGATVSTTSTSTKVRANTAKGISPPCHPNYKHTREDYRVVAIIVIEIIQIKE